MDARRGRPSVPLYVLVAVLAFGAALWFRLHAHAPDAATPELRERSPVRERARPIAFVARVSGRVLASTGTPLADARVCALDANSAPIGSPLAVCTRSGPDGGYQFERLAVGAYRMRAAMGGYLPGVARQGLPLQLTAASVHDGVDIVLQRGGARLAGSVVDASGGPIPYALVRAGSIQTQAVLDFECDGDGHFELWADPGNVALTASAPGYAPLMRPVVAPAEDVVLRLVPGAAIGGRVIARASGEAVAAVRVFALRAGTVPHPGVPSARSDDAGRFDIEGLEHGLYTLWGQSERWRGELLEPIELSVAERGQDRVLYVEPALQIGGRVEYADDGRPCGSGHVTLVAQGDAPGQELFAPIAMDGSVLLQGARPGTYGVEVYCDAARLQDGPTRLHVAGAEDMGGLVWKVRPGLSLLIRTVDGADKPVPNVDVLLWFPPDADGNRSSQTFTGDARGEIRVPALLAPGSYLVEAGHGARTPDVPVELREREPTREVVVRLPGAASIELSAADARGRPVDNLTIIASPLRASERAPELAKAPIIVSTTAPGLQEPSPRTQALMQRLQTGRLAQPLGGGRYRIAPLEAGTYEVRADDGVNPSVLARAAGASQIVVAHAPVEARVTIDAQSSIRGRVVDGAGGPVSDVWVSASSEDGAAKTEAVGEVPAHQRVLTDDDGRFEVAGLAGNARYSVRVERPFGALSLQRGVTPGQDVTIRLPALGGLSGTLIDPTGQPLPPFTIQVRELDTGHNQAELIRDPNGNWKLERVQPGTLRVSAILDGSGRVVNQTVELHEGEQLARIQLRLPER